MKRTPVINIARYEDPLSKALLPPPNETPSEREKRIQAQCEAIRISKEIDESLLESKKVLESRKKATKVLLLGQAESGKSTTLKNFQLSFCPAQFQQERTAWKMIIQLNLIRSVRQILQAMQEEWELSMPKKAPSYSRNGSAVRRDSESTPPSILTDNHRRMRMRLSPLVSVEEALTRRLFPTSADSNSNELAVQGGSGWIGYLTKVISKNSTRPKSAGAVQSDDATIILSNCREDIVELWHDEIVQHILQKREQRLQEMPGFFLDDAERIAMPHYEPTDQDVMRARIKTLGVEEHRFEVENGRLATGESRWWYIYDVNGSRGVRSQWASFFDDMQSIIFLAPLTFNLSLEEDPHVNRLEDSIMIWRSICANRLLAKSVLILFLNKMDILQSTLAAGVEVKKFVPSYGDQPNEFHSVVKYFRDKFRGYHKKLSPKPRPFFWHETSVIDTTSTSTILYGVREGILRAQLSDTHVI